MQNFWLISHCMQLWLFILYIISFWNFLHVISESSVIVEQLCQLCRYINFLFCVTQHAVHLSVSSFSIICTFYHSDAVLICDLCHSTISFSHWLQSIMFSSLQIICFLSRYKLIISCQHLSDKTNFIIINLSNDSSYFSYYHVSSFFISIIEFTVFLSYLVCLNFCVKLIILYNILMCSMNMISE